MASSRAIPPDRDARRGPVAAVLMEVMLASHRQANFDRSERAVRDIPGIVDGWSAGGGVDYVLKVMGRDIDAYQRLVRSIARSAATAASSRR